MADEELLSEFLAEGVDIVDRINGALDELSKNSDSPEVIDRMFRDIHTMKGTAGVFGVPEASELADQMETCLATVKKEKRPIEPDMINKVRQLAVSIENVLNFYKTGEKPANVTISDSQQIDEVNSPSESEGKKESVSLDRASDVLNNKSSHTSDDFLRVPAKRVNEVNNLIAEAFLTRNQLLYLVERLKVGKIDSKEFVHEWELLDSAMRRGLRDVGNAAMSMRMMSVRGVFTRMSRVLESYMVQTGKKIKFETVGGNTELDKKVLDVLSEPLIHLIRNAMDHGIESIEQRRAAGKSDSGTISLEAATEGNQFILKVSDDGKGIDPQKVLASAKSKGLDVSSVLDDKAAIHLIFFPGFSTAEKVTDVSGRGVGMDAVKSTVSELGGEVSIDTKVGRGTTFTIKLPMSMALTSVTVVDVNSVLYGIPAYEIIQTRKMSARDLKVNQGDRFVLYDGSFVTCMDLRPSLNKISGHEENFREISVLFFENRGKVQAAQVSRFVENTELVIKPIPVSFPRIPFVVGVSVLPTGEPIFVLSLRRFEENRMTSKPSEESKGQSYANKAA